MIARRQRLTPYRELSRACEQFIKQEDEGKFRCKTCQKLFKATSFVEKHISNKHPELVKHLEEVRYSFSTVSKHSLNRLPDTVLQQLRPGSPSHSAVHPPSSECRLQPAPSSPGVRPPSVSIPHGCSSTATLPAVWWLPSVPRCPRRVLGPLRVPLRSWWRVPSPAPSSRRGHGVAPIERPDQRCRPWLRSANRDAASASGVRGAAREAYGRAGVRARGASRTKRDRRCGSSAAAEREGGSSRPGGQEGQLRGRGPGRGGGRRADVLVVFVILLLSVWCIRLPFCAVLFTHCLGSVLVRRSLV